MTKSSKKRSVRPYIRLVREKPVEYFPQQELFVRAIRKVQGDLVYDSKRGWMLNGQPVKIQQILEKSGIDYEKKW